MVSDLKDESLLPLSHCGIMVIILHYAKIQSARPRTISMTFLSSSPIKELNRGICFN